ncbi:MAG: NAD(P)-dependent oxidoreductase [Hymenobacter sp.]
MGQIGGRVARWCVALGTDAATGPEPASRMGPARPSDAPPSGLPQLRGSVSGYDPYLPEGIGRALGVRRVDMDTLVDESEVVFVTVPPTPTSKHLLDRARIVRLRRRSAGGDRDAGPCSGHGGLAPAGAGGRTGPGLRRV